MSLSDNNQIPKNVFDTVLKHINKSTLKHNEKQECKDSESPDDILRNL